MSNPRGTLRRTWFAVRTALQRRGARAVTVVSAFGYLVVYLYAIDKLRFWADGFQLVVAEAPAQQFVRQSFGTFTYEPVFLVELWVLTYQFSMNTVIGLGVALLVGINLGVSYLAWRQPSSCGISSRSAGAFAGIPALLSGAACCAPVVVLVVGIQMTSTLLTVFELLLPIAVLLLVGSLLVVGRQIDDRAGLESA